MTFSFSVGEGVQTPQGEIGVIDMIGYDGRRNQYYVVTRRRSSWYRENVLSRIPHKDELKRKRGKSPQNRKKNGGSNGK